MMPATRASSRRRRRFVRLLLLATIVLFIFSIRFYTACFVVPGNGVSMHSGLLSLVISMEPSDTPGLVPPGFTCQVTDPIVVYKPLWAFTSRHVFLGLPLWVIALGAILFLARDLWIILRTRAGCCLDCGYDLTGLPRESLCPECGGARRNGAAATMAGKLCFKRPRVGVAMYLLAAAIALACAWSVFRATHVSMMLGIGWWLQSGRVYVMRNASATPLHLMRLPWVRPVSPQMHFTLEHWSNSTTQGVGIPLWVPVVVFALAGGVLEVRHRRRRRATQASVIKPIPPAGNPATPGG